ncbi:MAG TPA: cell filamentation protein Fic, partial [Gammaproteobacteria bacterium]|nr:cell filamentation protein Fic [Gammaproteobacteria bacterium]
MAVPHHQLLSNSLKICQNKTVRGVLRAQDISRVHLVRLIKNGWLTPIIRGWYLLKQPIAKEGESTNWYSSFWDFIAVYLEYRFGSDYCLSANDSLAVHLGSTTIPKQLLVMVKRGGSLLVKLPFNTSLMIYKETKTFPKSAQQKNGINIMPLPLALHRVSAQYFKTNPYDAEVALKMVDQLELSKELLSGSNIAAAGRIIGAYFFMKEKQKAEQLLDSLAAAGYQVEVVNPFLIRAPLLASYPRIQSPYAARVSMMWQQMRSTIIELFPKDLGIPKNKKNYFDTLEKIYVNDAYNSLSIEGYEVTENLIKQIAENKWSPEQSVDDKNQLNAMAAKGYLQAFKAVKQSIERIFLNENPGDIIKEDLHKWYAALFSAVVRAGILEPQHLAGYRSHQ